MSARTDKENIGMPSPSPPVASDPSHKTAKKPCGVGPRSGTKDSSFPSSSLGIAVGLSRGSPNRPPDQPPSVGGSSRAVARGHRGRSTTTAAAVVSGPSTKSGRQPVRRSSRSKTEPDVYSSSSSVLRTVALSQRSSGQGGGASSVKKVQQVSKNKIVSAAAAAAAAPPRPRPPVPPVLAASLKPDGKKRGRGKDVLVKGAGRSTSKKQKITTQERKGKGNRKVATSGATTKAPRAPPPRLSTVEGPSAFDFDVQEEDGDCDDGVGAAARVDSKFSTRTAHSEGEEKEHDSLNDLTAVGADHGDAAPRRCSNSGSRRPNGSGGSGRAATSADDGKSRKKKKLRAAGGRGRKESSTKKRTQLSDEVALAHGALEVAAAGTSSGPSSFLSQASSSGTQPEDSTRFSPLGSWNLRALFGDSEDEEGDGSHHRDIVPTWRLSDSDDADLVDDGAGRGGGSTSRRASGSSTRGGGIGGVGGSGGEWRSSKRASTSDSSKKEWRGVSKRVSGVGTTPRRKHSAVAAAASSDADDCDAAVAEEEASGSRAVVSLPIATLDASGLAEKARAPSAASKRQSREQQEEAEALQALRALYSKIDSHQLKFSR